MCEMPVTFLAALAQMQPPAGGVFKIVVAVVILRPSC